MKTLLQHWQKLSLLLAAVALLLPACTVDMSSLNSAQGTPALGREQVQQTLNTFLNKRPRTFQEMCDLMEDTPMAIGQDPKGDYAHWYRTETTCEGTQLRHHAAWAACLSRNGKIIASCIRLSDPNDISKHTNYGDAALYNPSAHPGLARVMYSHTDFLIKDAASEPPPPPDAADSIITIATKGIMVGASIATGTPIVTP